MRYPKKWKRERERDREKKEKWTKNKYDTIPITHHNLLCIDGNCTVFSDITIFRLFNLKNSIVIAIVTKNVDEDWKPVPK